MSILTELEMSHRAGWEEEYNAQRGEDCPECEEELQVFDWAVSAECPCCGADLDEEPAEFEWREDAAIGF